MIMNKEGKMRYFVEHNGKFVADYKTLKGCINYIDRKQYVDSWFESTRIFDQQGNEYNIITGARKRYVK